MSESQMSAGRNQTTVETTAVERILARAVRNHVEKLNNAISAAHESGLSINLGVSVFGDGRREVSNVRIERPGSWRDGTRGVEL